MKTPILTTHLALRAAKNTGIPSARRHRPWGGWFAMLGIAAIAWAPVAWAAADPDLISVDFVQSGGTPCSGDTLLTGTTMNNAVGNIFLGQVGPWNTLNIGTYTNSIATSGYLTSGSGTVTTAKLALGLATGLNSTLAGGWLALQSE